MKEENIASVHECMREQNFHGLKCNRPVTEKPVISTHELKFYNVFTLRGIAINRGGFAHLGVET